MFIVSPPRDDGFGAQFLNILRALIFSEAENNQFVWRPIETIACADCDNDPTYLNKINTYVNIAPFYSNFTNLEKGTVVYELREVITFYHLFIANFEKYHKSTAAEKYKAAFRHDKHSPHSSDYLNIVIHIRRTEKYQVVVDGKQVANPDFSDEYYAEFIRRMRETYVDSIKPVRFHFYSLGKPTDFPFVKAEDKDIVFHLQDDTLSSHLGMVFADVLLISHSCLSYTAAFLSDAEIYYRDWNHLHIGLPEWHRYD